jgi:hypothetical protein
MKVNPSMIRPRAKELFASTVSENAGKHPTSFSNSIRHEASDINNHISVKNNLTIVQCQGEDLAEIKSLLTPQSY